MKKLFFMSILILMVSLVIAGSPDMEEEKASWKEKSKIGLVGSMNRYWAPLWDNAPEANFGPGFGAFMDYYMKKNLALNLTFEYNHFSLEDPTKSTLNTNLLLLTLRGKYYFLPNQKFNPFLTAGLGPFGFIQNTRLKDRFYFDGLVTGGVGIDFPLTEKISLAPSVNYNLSHCKDFDYNSNSPDGYLNFSLAFSYDLGKGKKKIKQVQPEVIKPEKKVEEKVEKVKEEKVEEIKKKAEKVEEKVEKAKEEKVEKTEKVEKKVKEKVEKNYYKELQYMIQPNDYLVKIAGSIYEEKSKWRDIYTWNREMIGDNPNLIYPFHELHLKQVPVDNTNKLKYNFYNYEVGQNETLWSIAAKEYNNPYSWIVIYRDNKDVLGNKCQKLKAGTVLKLRSKLFNK